MKLKLNAIIAFGILSLVLSSCSRHYAYRSYVPVKQAKTEVKPRVEKDIELVTLASKNQPISPLQTPPVEELVIPKALNQKQEMSEPTARRAPNAAQETQVQESPVPFLHKQETKDQQQANGKGKPKSQIGALLFCFFLGALGIHRFYLGYYGIGIIQLLTLGGFGIWFLIDFVLILIGALQPKNGYYYDQFSGPDMNEKETPDDSRDL